ncbi:protein kinase [uncultured Sphingomonas sp.]|uniref:protein kinase domain-containing protein n=1 Tax=uncultured Sphingomonas sp. TaxID=158754 RepID=UPI0035CC4FC7
MRVEFERRVLGLFDRLLDQPPPDRDRWLREVTADDPELIAAVQALAAADERSGSLPTTPPAGPSPAEPPPPPERLGNFRVARELGRGGMGVVYLAERADGLFDQQVALKLIRHHVTGRAADAFVAERRLLARIEHPNVARLIDAGVAPDGRPWLATEYVAGEAIDRGAAGRPLAANVRLVLQATQAVEFAHTRLIAHGDVKPANLLVGEGGRVKLLDFGVARLLGSDALPAAGALTPGFASPERLAGAPPSVADDVYALGRTLALLTAASRDAELQAIIRRATTVEAARYRTAQALASDLEAWLERRPVAAMDGGPAYRARSFVRRHRFGVAAALLSVLGLCGAALVNQRNYRRAEQARHAEAARFDDAYRTAHYLMFTLLDRLERQPGTLRLRAQVGETAQAYLDRLAAVPHAPRAVRLDVATGYLRAASMAGMSNAPNLGDVDRAHRDLAQAVGMLEQLRREEPGWAALGPPLGRAYSLRCQNQIYGTSHDAKAALREARAGLRVLATVGGDPATRAAATWQVRICAGDALVWLDRAPEAVTLLEHDLAAGRARRPLDRNMLERNLRLLGEAYFYAKRFPDAERVLKEAAAIQADAHAREPFYGAAVNEASNVADDLASTYNEQRRFADQLRVSQAALRLVQTQAGLDPDDVQSQRRALSMSRLVADALARTGLPADGAALMERANRGWDALGRRYGDDASTARLRLLALEVTANLHRRAGARTAACQTYRAADDGWTAFGRRWRLSPADRDESVARIRHNLAACAGRGTFIDS